VPLTGLMENVMSKTNDTSRLGCELTEAELHAAVGGRITNVRVNATPVHSPSSQLPQVPSVTVNGGPLAFV
jgi:hypothetical protein